MKKIFFLILIVSFILLTFTACKSNNTENKDSENTIRNFITTVYSVDQSDFDYYQEMIKGATSSNLIDYQNTYNANTEKFQQYLAQSSYDDFYHEYLSYMRIYDAFKNNNFIKVQNLKITKINEDKIKKTISYHYDMKIKQTNKDTKKPNILGKSGNLTLTDERGTWKIIDTITL